MPPLAAADWLARPRPGQVGAGNIQGRACLHQPPPFFSKASAPVSEVRSSSLLMLHWIEGIITFAHCGILAHAQPLAFCLPRHRKTHLARSLHSNLDTRLDAQKRCEARTLIMMLSSKCRRQTRMCRSLPRQPGYRALQSRWSWPQTARMPRWQAFASRSKTTSTALACPPRRPARHLPTRHKRMRPWCHSCFKPVRR